MHKYTCIVCGKQGESQTLGRSYCSGRCRAAARRRRLKETETETEQQCRFNEGVACNGGDCSACGWNKEVSDRRLEAFLGRVGV